MIQRKVKEVIDGNTFTVSRKIGNVNMIRLAGVDTPEKNQPGYRAAANRLKRLIEGKTVTIVPVGKSYGKIATDVRSKRKLVNKRLRKR